MEADGKINTQSERNPVIGGYLKNVRSKLYATLLVEGSAALLESVCLLFALVWLFFAIGLPALPLRIAFWSAFILWSVYLIGKHIWFPVSHFKSDDGLAHFIEDRNPKLKDKLLSAVQLDELLSSEKPLHFSNTLARANVEEIAVKVGAEKASDAVATASMWLRMLRAVAAILTLLVLGSIWPVSGKTAFAALFGDDALASYYSGSVEFLAGDIKLTYRYPAYTGLPEMQVPNSSGEVEAYPGTQVTVSVSSFESADEGRLVMKSGREVALIEKSGGRFEGAFALMEEDRYRFEFDGEADGRDHAVKVRPDRVPSVLLDFPVEEELEVRETDTLELIYRIEDDFGITGAALVFNYDDGTKRVDERIEVGTFDASLQSKNGKWLWDLNNYSFTPGDRVAYHFEAEDNDTVSGPKSGSSPVRYLKIFSMREHHRKLLERQEEIWEAMIAELAKDLENVIDEKSIPNLAVLLTRYIFKEKELEENIRKPVADLLQEMLDDPLGTEATTGLFEQIKTDFDKQVASFEMTRRDLERYPGQNNFLQGYRQQFDSLIQQTVRKLERFIIDLKDLIAKQRYDSLVTDAEKLARLRDELRDLIEQYKASGDEALKERILEKLRQFRSLLTQLRQGLAKTQKEISEEFVNIEAIETKELDEDLAALEKLLKADDLDSALQQMSDLSAELDQVLDQLKEGSEDLGESLYSESMKQLEEFQKEVEELSKLEQELKEKTEQRYEAFKEALKKKMLHGLEKKLDGIRKKVEKAKRQSELIDPDGRETINSYRARALQYIDGLLETLKLGDVMESIEMAKSGTSYLEAIERIIVGSFPPERKHLAERESAVGQSRKASKTMKEVKEELEELMPGPDKIMGQKERKMLEELSKKQQRLGQEAGNMSHKLQGMQQEMPFFPSEATEEMNQARFGMDRASESLKQMKPGQAGEKQQEVMHHLEQVKKGLQGAKKKMMSGMKYGGMKPGMRGGKGRRHKKEKVSLPSADEFKTPKELRDDILKAMKQPAPENYKEQNKQYYKELVK